MPDLTILDGDILMFGGEAEDWGLIPSFLDHDDPRTAKEQFADKYVGGWNSFSGFKWDAVNRILTYGEGEDADPPMRPISYIMFRMEIIRLFPHAWVMIEQPDSSWEISRMD